MITNITQSSIAITLITYRSKTANTIAIIPKENVNIIVISSTNQIFSGGGTIVSTNLSPLENSGQETYQEKQSNWPE